MKRPDWQPLSDVAIGAMPWLAGSASSQPVLARAPEVKSASYAIKVAETGGIAAIEGYAAAYNNVDSTGDIIKKDAFRQALADAQPPGWRRDLRR